MQIGDKFFHFDENVRRYRRDKDGQSEGGPIYREHFIECEILGETSRSWIIGHGGEFALELFRVPKSNPFKVRHGEFGVRKAILTEPMVESECWAHDHRHKIIEAVRKCDDQMLYVVALVIDYVKATEEPIDHAGQ